jgi:hypothetical protein
MEFRQATAADLTALAPFLRRAFQAKEGEPIVDARQMQWKLFEPRPDWVGSRSFILTQGDSIVAHCCVCPVTFIGASRRIRGIVTLDWASGVVGAGIAMLQKVYPLSETHLVINGTPATQAIVTKLRYQRLGEIRTYRLIARRWQLVRGRSIRRVLGLARRRDAWRVLWNAARSRPIAVDRRSEWSVERVARFNEHAAPPLPREPFRGCTLVERDLALLNYMLLCPAAEFSGFQIYYKGECAGYFLLSRVGSQARIADLYVDSEDPGNWTTAYSLAARTAMEDPRVGEVIAATSAPFVEEAIQNSGFRLSHCGPIFLRDPGRVLSQLPPPNLNLLDGDMAYL